MCGIAAIVSKGNRAALGTIEAMVATQQKRGPDASATRDRFGTAPGDAGEVAMGHTRLSLVDLAPTGDQPMEGERYVLTYNGEIYNHQQLRSHCTSYRWQGTSDTETLLALIETFGVRKALPMLNGMFAFAVWDKKERVLWMATDPFGIKPLYVHHQPELTNTPAVFACASSSAALLHLKPKWKVDRASVLRYFHLGGTNGMWQGIDRMSGGSLAVYDPKQARYREERWYHPTFWENATPCDMQDLVVDAIRISAKADVPVGIFFSGGIDTSVVASVVSDHAKRSLTAAQATRDGHPRSKAATPADGLAAFHLDGAERKYAEFGANHFGLDLHVVTPGTGTVKALLDIAEQTGEPTMAGHIPYVVSQAAAEHVKACISGNGADELFFGYPRTATNGREVAAMHAHLFRNEDAYAPKDQRAHWNPCELADDRFPFDAHTRWTELQHYIEHDLNPTLDAASMCHSLELRVPFLDVRVAECALSMPFAVHGRKEILKQMLAAAGLPPSYYEREKLGFSMPQPGRDWEQYSHEGWRMACQRYGFRPIAPRSYRMADRDIGYLKAAAAGWRAWYEVHRPLIQE